MPVKAQTLSLLAQTLGILEQEPSWRRVRQMIRAELTDERGDIATFRTILQQSLINLMDNAITEEKKIK